jgi:uncharacterized membrane protein YgcG
MDLGLPPAAELGANQGSGRDSDTLARAREKLAAEFAQTVHNAWGVGNRVLCSSDQEPAEGAGTGVLLFLSELDRVVHISRGDSVAAYLTNRRLDRTIDRMKPFLRQGQYGYAIVGAIRDIDHFFMQGPPGTWEKANDFLLDYGGVVVMLILFFFLIRSVKKQERERREYAKVTRHLSELDRARAEALQGEYRTESCPICLELFQAPVVSATRCSLANEQTTGSEQVQEILSNESSEIVAGSNKPIDPAPAVSQRLGSDGAPLKLLRCGHVFDESCWEQWIQSGRGNLFQCPICKRDLGPQTEPGSGGRRTLTGTGPRVRRTAVAEPSSSIAVTEQVINNEGFSHSETDSSSQNDGVVHRNALRQYNYERQFRLERLLSRYPRYIRTDLVSRWSSSAYEGALVRDVDFVTSDPDREILRRAARDRLEHAAKGGTSPGSSYNNGGFGGGTSGGGRGGSW